VNWSVRCLFLGHEDLVRHAAGRLFLECAECGRETSGWDIKPNIAEPRNSAMDDAPLPVTCEARVVSSIWDGANRREPGVGQPLQSFSKAA